MKKVLAGLGLTLLFGGAPVIPTPAPFLYAYQTTPQSQVTTVPASGTSSAFTIPSDRPTFTDDDHNGIISVAVFQGVNGKEYVQIPDALYTAMGTKGGSKFNPTHTSFGSVFGSVINPPKAHAAIAFDGEGRGNDNPVTSITVSVTTSGTNRMLFCGAEVRNTASDDITGITYNSVAMTRVGSQTANPNGFTALYYLVAPATGANNAVASFGGADNVQIACLSFTGVSQSFSIPSETKGNTSLDGSGTLTINLTTQNAGSAIVGYELDDNCGGANTAGSGYTLKNLGVCSWYQMEYQLGFSAGAQTYTYGQGTNSKSGAVAVTFSPAAASTINAGVPVYVNPSWIE